MSTLLEKDATLLFDSMSENLFDGNLFQEFYGSQPQGILWLAPVWDDQKNVSDFTYVYANRPGLQFLQLKTSMLEKVTVKNCSSLTEKKKIAVLSELMEAYNNGTSTPTKIYNPLIKKYGKIYGTRFRNGVLATIYDSTHENNVIEKLEKQTRELEYQESFSNSILDASPDGIFAMEAVRDEMNEIVDFKILKINKAYTKIIGKPSSEVTNNRLLQLFPNAAKAGSFDLYCQVIATGKSVRTEMFYNGEGLNSWFDISIVKWRENGIVCTFSDISERKKIELDREQNALLVQTMLNASFHGKALLEPVKDESGVISDFRVVATNTATEKQIGIKQQVAVGGYLSQLLPEYKKSGGFDNYKNAFETGKSKRYEQYYKDDRFEGWFDIYVVPVNNGIVISFANITERKQEVLDIQRQKNMLDAIMTHSPSGISVTEIIRDHEEKVDDAITILANEAAIKFVGIPKDLYLTKTAKELEPGIFNSPLYKMALHTLATGEGFQTQYFLEASKRWLELSIAKMDDNHLINVFTDVTETKKAQLELETFAEKLNTVINTSQTGFFLGSPVTDETGDIVDFRFTMVNKVMASFVEREPQELIGELGSDWFVAYKKNGLFDRFKDAYLSGKREQFDIHYMGETVEVWANVMTTKLGNELLGSFTDFTPLKALQIQLEKSVDDLSRSNKNLEEFAYIASHDLQEPLRKINFFSEQLKQELSSSLSEQAGKKFDRMMNATHRMKTLISDLLEYSKLSVPIDLTEDIELSEIVEQVLQDLEATILSTGAVVEVGKLPKIKGDARQFTQLFLNIISNALKYRRSTVAPKIVIHSDVITDTNTLLAEFAGVKKGNYYFIEIADNGIGFEQEHAGKIFQVFQRLHGRSEYEGTGVGLAIVQKVISNHNGYITAVGKPEKGSSFRIFLPAGKTSEKHEAHATS